jgi:glyoxylase-like metal-dependent hydrolase (beta-lactamase superfamily II)
MLRGGRRKQIRCPAVAVLLEHPTHGFLLFDTGYAPRVIEAMKPFPFSIYARVTPIFLLEGQAVKHQLHRLGLQTRDIKTIIMSHFHADHIGGLLDFPDAQMVCSRDALQDVQRRQGFDALRRAFVPALLPPNLEGRSQLIGTFADEPLGLFGPTHDLFGDGLLRLVQLPGHAKGQIGLLAQTPTGPVFFAADGCYLRRNFEENIYPHPSSLLFVDDPRATLQTISKLHDLYLSRADITILPCHDLNTLE